MKTEQLSKEEIRELKRRKRPSVILGLIFLATISLVNLVMWNMNLYERKEANKRPIAQVIVVEFVAVLIAGYTYYFFSKAFTKDIKDGIKNIKEKKVLKKKIKNNDVDPEYILVLSNSLSVFIEEEEYNSLKVGDTVKVHEAPNSTHFFKVEV